MKKNKKLFYLFTLMVLAACQNSGDKKKQDKSTPDITRVVCVSKQLNEIIFELGAGSHIVGTDLTSVYPDAVKNLPKVGYHRLLSAEGIISLKPTLVLHDGNIAPANVVTQLEKVGIMIKEIPEGKSIDDTKTLTKALGDLFDRKSTADSLCAALDSDLGAVLKKVKTYKTRPRVIVVHYGQQSNRYLVVGKASASTKLIEMAGGINAIDIDKGMGPLSAEIIAKAQPDIILATDVGFDQKGSVEEFKKLPGIAQTPAGKNNRIYRVDERTIIYFTPGTGKTLAQLADLLHPQQ